MIEKSFQRYLMSKQSVDDRALNQTVLSELKAHLTKKPISIVEIGAGIGTMLVRMLRWDMLSGAEYILVDEMAENIHYGARFIRKWAVDQGFEVKQTGSGSLHVFDDSHSIQAQFVQADVFEYLSNDPAPVDILIAHAFLDLMPLPEKLSQLLSLTKKLAWLTINFDGVSAFEPEIDFELDKKIESLYHNSMDMRTGGGDSRAGRHLFKYLEEAGARLLAAGASDWVVYPRAGVYPADEAYFLNFILSFFDETLKDHPDLEPAEFSLWLQTRRDQIKRGELVYIAHQIDFLAEVNSLTV